MVWQSVLYPHKFGVYRRGFSPHDWETATRIRDKFFMIGQLYSGSFHAEPDDSTRGMVYFLSQDNYNIFSFDVHCRSLTTHYHALHFEDYNSSTGYEALL